MVDIMGKKLNKDKIEQHLMSHSYKSSSNLNYKCDECDFWGPNTLTLEVLRKKCHSENITCLCEYVAKSIENLEMHQFTCEVYKCDECTNISKTLKEVKDHVNTVHKDKFVWVHHIKSDRKNSEYFDSKSYTPKDLFKRPIQTNTKMTS